MIRLVSKQIDTFPSVIECIGQVSRGSDVTPCVGASFCRVVAAP